MKKWTMCLCAGLVMLGLASCGDDAQGNSSGSDVQGGSGTPENTAVPEGSDAGNAGGGAGQPDTTDGWSEEMAGLKGAVVEALGDNYWPNMPLDAEMLEAVYGVSPDMYDDFMAEMPMISAQVDALVVIKAKEDKVTAVEDALKAYRDVQINDALQYPMNVSKVQASSVEKIDNYVVFVQLGADTMSVMDVSEEAAIVQCQEANKLAVDAISKKLGK